jgi:hypothetical protein
MTVEQSLAIATIAQPGARSEPDALILAESVRRFGGGMSDSPLWCFYPQGPANLSPTFQNRMNELQVDLIPFELAEKDSKKWFVGHASAAALAESRAEREHKLLAWLSPNAVVVNEPSEFLLADRVSLGYRPVHHALIGSRFDDELDSYWSLVYELSQVPEERVFPMKTHVETIFVRPYFNAGFLVVRPRSRILRGWRDLFLPLYSDKRLEQFYERDARYEIFIHQALLSGLILKMLNRNGMVELPPTYNYPVHLHGEDQTEDRPRLMDDTVVFRHEGFYKEAGWKNIFPGSERLKGWLASTARTAVGV